MYKVVHSPDVITREIENNKTAKNLIGKGITDNFSIAVIDGQDYSGDEITEYNRIYFVLDGELRLRFGERSEVLRQGDSCYIEKGSEYEMHGTFSVLVVNQPAYGT